MKHKTRGLTIRQTYGQGASSDDDSAKKFASCKKLRN